MNTIKSFYSCAELAAMRLPGLPTDPRSIREKAKREGWQGRERYGRGGGAEYQPPAKIRALIGMAQLKQMRPELSQSMLKELRGISRHINNMIKIMGDYDD